MGAWGLHSKSNPCLFTIQHCVPSTWVATCVWQQTTTPLSSSRTIATTIAGVDNLLTWWAGWLPYLRQLSVLSMGGMLPVFVYCGYIEDNGAISNTERYTSNTRVMCDVHTVTPLQCACVCVCHSANTHDPKSTRLHWSVNIWYGASVIVQYTLNG